MLEGFTWSWRSVTIAKVIYLLNCPIVGFSIMEYSGIIHAKFLKTIRCSSEGSCKESEISIYDEVEIRI